MSCVASLRPAPTALREQHGLWILPEAWKAPKQTGPSHTSLDGATGAAHKAPQAPSLDLQPSTMILNRP
jgi:hypothetical protein